jgi:uncharacterized Zn finger protein
MRKKKGTPLLAQILTRSTLLELAGDRYFARGEKYAHEGRVRELALDGDGISAQVRGSEAYDVDLWIEEDELQASCNCPVGADNLFCKHCVAVGLTWLADPTSVQPQQKNHPPQKPVTLDDVQHFLEQQEKSTLVQWIVDRVQQDADWKQHFVLQVASRRPQGIDIKTFQRALRESIEVWDLIEWNEVVDYADKIWTVLRSIQDLLEPQPQIVIELCEYGLSLLETALNSIDDSGGDIGMVMEEFQTLHYSACERAQPDPIALAERLFHAEMNSQFGSFSSAVETYAAILGQAGIAHYRQQAEAAWSAIPATTPEEPGRFRRRRSPSFDSSHTQHQRWKLQRILESLAKMDGDLEALVNIKRQDLSHPHSYLAIAQLYLEAGQRNRALEWAESGLKAFDFRTPKLQEFVVEEYHRRGRNEEAMELIWQSFTQSITLRSYQELKNHAERSQQWAIWRDRALTQIRQLLEPPPTPTRRGSKTTRNSAPEKPTPPRYSPALYGVGRSILVEIFLWEGDAESAWQEAKAGDCSRSLWLKLAELRQRDHPADAIPIYTQAIEPLIQETHNAAYANAVDLLNKVHHLMMRLNQQTEFLTYVDRLRQTYKAKRNFIALLNQQKW